MWSHSTSPKQRYCRRDSAGAAWEQSRAWRRIWYAEARRAGGLDPARGAQPSEDEAYRALGGLCQDWLDATIEATLCDRRVPREPRFNQLMSPSTYYVPQDVAPYRSCTARTRSTWQHGGIDRAAARGMRGGAEPLRPTRGWTRTTRTRGQGLEGSWRAYDTEVICALRLVKACKASIRLGALMVFS